LNPDSWAVPLNLSAHFWFLSDYFLLTIKRC